MREFGSYSRIRDTARVLREIITIVMGISFTLCIVMFLTERVNADATAGVPRSIASITLASVLAFVAVITAIARFFHGNVNYISSTYNTVDAVALKRRYNVRLAIDFAFIFLQAFLFCCLAVYQSIPDVFYRIFMTLFFVDGLWFVVIFAFVKSCKDQTGIQEDTTSAWGRRDEPKVVYWMVASLVTGALMLAVMPQMQSRPLDAQYWLFGLIMANSIVDYSLNWGLYFPAFGLHRGDPVFLAARFTTAIGEDGSFDEALREKIELVHRVVHNEGFTPWSSQSTEEFGQKLGRPDQFVARDFDDIGKSKLFILLLDHGISAGAFTELGWAACLGKPLLIFIPAFPPSFTKSMPIIDGLDRACKYCRVHRYSDLSTLEVQLKTALNEVAALLPTYMTRRRMI